MKKLFRYGLSINAAILMIGYLNSERRPSFEIDREVFDKKFDFADFKSKLDDFNSKFPQYYTNKKPVSRSDNLERMRNEKFDILVIGGGCNGAGVLLEADQRGFKGALIESDDFASKTSSRSTKMIHGGIRYLYDAFMPGSGAHVEKLKLVFEALQERDFFVKSVPYMTDIVEIKTPYKHFFEMDYFFSGLLVYHFLYAVNNFPHIFTTIPWPRLYFYNKQVSFFEGQMFDSRQNLLSILSCNNSTYANYTKFKEYIYSPSGKIIGVKAVDLISHKEFEILSECVVNCTGIFADSNFNKEDDLKDKLISASKGAHLVVRKQLFKNLNSGFMIPKTTDGRILFIWPYQKDYFIVGTTDNEMEKRDKVSAEQTDVDFICRELNKNLKLSDEEIRNNISSQWAGLRPLVRNPQDIHAAKSLARNHVIRVDETSGLVSLLGGKWTTYRRMGEDVINEIYKHNLVNTENKPLVASNLNLKLNGATHFLNVSNTQLSYADEKNFYAGLENYLVNQYRISKKLASKLVFKYGLNSIRVMDVDKEIPVKDKYLLSGSNPLLAAELTYSMRYEMAVKPNDFLCRRTGLAFVEMKAAESLLETTTNLMARELKWSREVYKKEKDNAMANLRYLI